MKRREEEVSGRLVEQKMWNKYEGAKMIRKEDKQQEGDEGRIRAMARDG